MMQKFLIPPRDTATGNELNKFYLQVASALNKLLANNSLAGEPTGFIDTTATLSWADGTMSLTITGTHTFFQAGVYYSKGTTTVPLSADTTGLHFYYYDDGVLTTSMSWPGFSVPLVAIVYWNTTTNKGLLTEERHGFVMDGDTHAWMHNTVGPRYVSGLVGTFDNTTFSMTAGVIYDEDLSISIGAATTCNILYKDGSSDWAWDAAQTNYMKMNGGNVRYNNGTALADASSNYYVAYWFFATNDATNPIWVIMGQRQDTTIANARANNTYESLSLGTLPSKEMKLLYRVIVRNDATPYEEAQDLRQVSNIPAGTYIAPDHGMLAGLADDDHTQYLLRTDVSNTLAHAYLGTDMTTMTSGSPEKITLDTELFDIGGNFANYRYTAPSTGYYLVNFAAYAQPGAQTPTSFVAYILVNGSSYQYWGSYGAAASGYYLSTGSAILTLNATDYFELWGLGFCGSAGDYNINAGGECTYITVCRIA